VRKLRKEVILMDTIKIDHGETKMIAHRGVSGIELENTCASFLLAGSKSYFAVESDGFLLSNSSSDDDFTAEFNVVGTGKMIFGYNDTKNYSYLELSDSSIDIYRVKDGKKNYVDGVDFNKSYDFSALHTLRISYADGLADIYFDSIEKSAGLEVDLVGGKIGFLSDNSFDDISYVSLSDHGRGSSDQTEYKKGRVLANSYDRKLSYFRKGSGLSETDGGTFIKQDYQNIKLVNEGDRATY
jgi:hypothetical protein